MLVLEFSSLESMLRLPLDLRPGEESIVRVLDEDCILLDRVILVLNFICCFYFLLLILAYSICLAMVE